MLKKNYRKNIKQKIIKTIYKKESCVKACDTENATLAEQYVASVAHS